MSAIEPRWKQGSVIGDLSVIRVVGRQLIRSGKAKMWVYECKCGCGRVELLTQEKLVGGRSNCCQCMMKSRHSRSCPTFKRPAELPEHVPNFAVLPVPEGIKTGPEKY